jgi:cellulose synthase/poly-beta-1,6-N-acetylglucosamine synthase-like glycosyltransferase
MASHCSGGDNPEWSQDGGQLFYHKGDTVMTVPIKIEQASSMEKPEVFSLRRILAALFSAPKSRTGIAALLLYILCMAFVVIVVLSIVSAFSNIPSGHPSPSYIAIIFVLVLPIYGVAATLFGIAGTFVLMRRRNGALLAIVLIIPDVISGVLRLTRGQPNTFMQIALVSWIAIDCLAFVMVALSWNNFDRP